VNGTLVRAPFEMHFSFFGKKVVKVRESFGLGLLLLASFNGKPAPLGEGTGWVFLATAFPPGGKRRSEGTKTEAAGKAAREGKENLVRG